MQPINLTRFIVGLVAAGVALTRSSTAHADETNKLVVLAIRVGDRLEEVKPCPTVMNSFYITRALESTYEIPGVGLVLRPEKIEEARRDKESQPAAEDPGGHWGEPDSGFQLSIRFAKATFTVGEPIEAGVIFRNVTNETLYAPADIPRFDTEFVITDETGEQLVPKKPANWDRMSQFEKRLTEVVQSPKFSTLIPHTQERYSVNLNMLFDLAANQTYQVQVRYRRKASGAPPVDVVSGKARIKIMSVRDDFDLRSLGMPGAPARRGASEPRQQR